MLDLEILEQESSTYLAGHVVQGVENGFACPDCQAALPDDSNACRLQQLKSYTKHKMTLALPSAAVLQVVEFAEAYVRKNVLDLLTNKVSVPALREKVMASLFTPNSFPPCHELPKRIVQLFLQRRMHILVNKSNAKAERKRVASRKSGSTRVSMGSHYKRAIVLFMLLPISRVLRNV